MPADVVVRPARTSDVRAIRRLVDLYVDDRRLLSKATVTLYEDVPDFTVATVAGEVVGAARCTSCGRTWPRSGPSPSTRPCAGAESGTLSWSGSWRGPASRRRASVLPDVRDGVLRAARVRGDRGGAPVAHEVYEQLLQSYDEGVASSSTWSGSSRTPSATTGRVVARTSGGVRRRSRWWHCCSSSVNAWSAARRSADDAARLLPGRPAPAWLRPAGPPRPCPRSRSAGPHSTRYSVLRVGRPRRPFRRAGCRRRSVRRRTGASRTPARAPTRRVPSPIRTRSSSGTNPSSERLTTTTSRVHRLDGLCQCRGHLALAVDGLRVPASRLSSRLHATPYVAGASQRTSVSRRGEFVK